MNSKARASPEGPPVDLHDRAMAAYGDHEKATRVANDVVDFWAFLSRKGEPEKAERFLRESLESMADIARKRACGTAKVLAFASRHGQTIATHVIATLLTMLLLTMAGSHSL